MRVGSLFAGIGGLELGLERSGMSVRWQVEIDERCRRVLAKHWPGATRYDDIRTLRGDDLEPVDLICGGFPCQDISSAGKRAGIDGEQSGLWREFARLVRDLRPRYVVVENVPALLNRGMGRVLGDLAACGYDAEWQVLSAEAFGAPHIRERLFIVAYDGSERHRTPAHEIFAGWDAAEYGRWWTSEPGVGRVADGVPDQVERLRELGNAVVPQVAEYIGRRIMAAAHAEAR